MVLSKNKLPSLIRNLMATTLGYMQVKGVSCQAFCNSALQSLLSINLVEKQQPLITPSTSNKSEHSMSVSFSLNKSLIEQRGSNVIIASNGSGKCHRAQ